MLLWLTEMLAKDVRAFNVFGYLTLRAVLATMTALVISFLIGPRMIVWLARMKIGQSVRDDGPQTHLIKAGTPIFVQRRAAGLSAADKTINFPAPGS